MKFNHTFSEIISVENLLAAWEGFVRGKRKRADVQAFQLRLMDNILSLHADLCNQTYRHAPYHHFRISDPKPRDIHKASVRDRLLHHALYRKLYPFFDRTFIFDSYSCRQRKGTHRALNQFRALSSWIHEGNRRACFVLKCDIRKFFANIDHAILLHILSLSISDTYVLHLLENVISSFNSGVVGKGLPLDNLTSQLLVNIYLNEFDQFVKHRLKAKFYIRYADDFVILSEDKKYLEMLLPQVADFLQEKFKLSLHPDKVFIKTLSSGVDFLGWVHFPDHRVLRTATKKRVLRNINERNSGSYLGLLKHGNAFTLQKRVMESYNEYHART